MPNQCKGRRCDWRHDVDKVRSIGNYIVNKPVSVFNKKNFKKIIKYARLGKPSNENIRKLETMINNAKSFLGRDADKAEELRKALLTKLLVTDTLPFSKVKVIKENLLRCPKIASKAGCCSCGEECASDCLNG
jgi:hypothetical protein